MEEDASKTVELEDFITQHCFHAVGQQIMSFLDLPALTKCRLLNSAWKSQIDKYLESKHWDISDFRLEETTFSYINEDEKPAVVKYVSNIVKLLSLLIT